MFCLFIAVFMCVCVCVGTTVWVGLRLQIGGLDDSQGTRWSGTLLGPCAAQPNHPFSHLQLTVAVESLSVLTSILESSAQLNLLSWSLVV